MDSFRYSHPEREAIAATAADWMLAHDRGLTNKEEAEFERWVNESELHAAAWHEARAAWCRLDRLAELPKETLTHGADWEVVKPREQPAAPEKARRAGWKIMLPWAVAATLAIGPAAFWWQSRPTLPHVSTIDHPQAEVITLAPHQLVLPDGSQIHLNVDSEISEEFTAAERHVRLVRGEAHFTVTQDVTRPFVVEAGGVTVRAVGTAFSVKLDAASVEVLVTEGTVRLVEGRAGAVIPGATEEIASDSSFLDAGRRAIIPLVQTENFSPEIAEVTSDDIQAALAWQAVRLRFADLPLERVAEEFNRLNAMQLRVDDSARDTIVAGTFRADNVLVFVDFMERAFGLTADRRSDGTILLAKTRP